MRSRLGRDCSSPGDLRGTVADNYGIGCYALFLFALTIWWSHRWEDSNACPYVSFEECALGSMGVLEVLVRTVAATIGGIAVFQ